MQVHGLDPKHRLLFLEQVNQWLGVLGIHIEWRLQVSRPHNTSHMCMTDLGWFQRKRNKLSQIYGGKLHLKHVNLEKITSYTKHILHERDMKIMLTKVSNTSFNVQHNHGDDKYAADGHNNNSSGFPFRRNSIVRWTSDSIGQTQRYNGVCSRDQPRVRQHYEHCWFWFDLTIAHVQIKVLTRW